MTPAEIAASLTPAQRKAVAAAAAGNPLVGRWSHDGVKCSVATLYACEDLGIIMRDRRITGRWAATRLGRAVAAALEGTDER